MLIYPYIDPVALELGPVKIHWYGITYLLAFLMAWLLGRYRLAHSDSGWKRSQFSDLIFYGILGVILGGRIGYILFYDFAAFMSDPVRLFRVWDGGMSFHGGMLGVLAAVWLYARSQGWRFFQASDFIAPLVPLGLGAGRIGNFINGELWGSESTLPWAMKVSCLDPRFSSYCQKAGADGFSPAMHPSMLYEALLEGLVLFLILWFYSRKPRPMMSVSGLFLLGYGSFRFLVEFVRTPDAHIGYLAGNWLTMGHVLSMPMIVFGLLLMVLAWRRPVVAESAPTK